MRKIEQWMINTIKAQRSRNWENPDYNGAEISAVKQNTKVRTAKRLDGATVTSVFLHENLIAQFSGITFHGEPAIWGFNLCGWNTPTTKSRINAIANAFGRDGVYQRKGKLYSGEKEINSHEWF